MSCDVIFDYETIVEKESLLIPYLVKNSNSFSVLPIIKRPYSQMPPDFNYNAQFSPFAIKYLFDRKDWPVPYLSHLKHQIMVLCRCCKESRNMLASLPNLFLPLEHGLPEDICFYRDRKAWFVTISHEKMASAYNVTNTDITFFKAHNIRFSNASAE